MPVLLLWLIVGAVLYGLAAPDPVTLRTTRGAVGAVGAIRSGRPIRGRATRPGPTRPGRPARPSRPGRAGRPSPAAPTRPASPIARGIRGWIDGADRATKRRGEAAAAVHDLLDRLRARKAAKQSAAAWDPAHAEDQLRDRAKQRARISEAVEPIAAQYDPPAAPARPNGGHVPDSYTPDFINISVTELDTLDQAEAEVEAAKQLAEQLTEGLKQLNDWHLNFHERYRGATDLAKNGQMNAAVGLAAEYPINSLQIDVQKFAGKLGLFLQGVANARQHVQESELQTGRVESARAN